MKVNISQSIRTNVGNAVSAAKRITKSGLNSIKNAFERSPVSDLYECSTKFSKSGIPESDKKYIEQINKVPILGVGKTELPILKLVQESMFKMLKLTNGKIEPYSEILFAHSSNPQTVASTYYPSKSLCVNKSFLKNIDELIKCNNKVFEIVEWIKVDKDGKYKILDILRNKKSEQFEKMLNEYTPEWSLKDKILLDSLGTYYGNLASQTLHNSKTTVKKILENKENYQLLEQKGLIKDEKDIFPLESCWRDYLFEIGKYCHMPEDTCLITNPEIAFDHEYIHKWCFDTFSEEYLDELHSKPVLQKWKDEKKTQLIANKVSIRAAENPMEYIAEVGSGLANGQKFDKDVMLLYESLKGPKI